MNLAKLEKSNQKLKLVVENGHVTLMGGELTLKAPVSYLRRVVFSATMCVLTAAGGTWWCWPDNADTCDLPSVDPHEDMDHAPAPRHHPDTGWPVTAR